MISLYIILAIVVLLSSKIVHKGYSNDYIGKDTCNSIKGIFIWLVFISHIAQYISPQLLDYSFKLTRSFLGQMIVVPFMFYSGYGMMLNTKREGYVKSIPSKRVMTVLLNFDVAVILFIIMDLAIGADITLKQSLLSLIAWDSVGNRNWYIFSIIIMYLLTYITSLMFGYSKKAVVALFMLTGVYSLTMCFFKPSWWYDTTFAYAFGSLFCLYQKLIEPIIKRHYYLILISSVLGFVLMYFVPDYVGLATNIRSMVLSLLIVVISMKFLLRSKFLAWSGKNLFPIYIYQRLPMIALSVVPIGSSSLIEQNVAFYIIACFFATLIITYLHKFISIKL